jgi:hypothetical protein
MRSVSQSLVQAQGTVYVEDATPADCDVLLVRAPFDDAAELSFDSGSFWFFPANGNVEVETPLTATVPAVVEGDVLDAEVTLTFTMSGAAPPPAGVATVACLVVVSVDDGANWLAYASANVVAELTYPTDGHTPILSARLNSRIQMALPAVTSADGSAMVRVLAETNVADCFVTSELEEVGAWLVVTRTHAECAPDFENQTVTPIPAELIQPVPWYVAPP